MSDEQKTEEKQGPDPWLMSRDVVNVIARQAALMQRLPLELMLEGYRQADMTRPDVQGAVKMVRAAQTFVGEIQKAFEEGIENGSLEAPGPVEAEA